MILFFGDATNSVFAVDTSLPISQQNLEKLIWLFGNAQQINEDKIDGNFIGPRASMITPWSTNAVDICLNMGLDGIRRIEKYFYDGEGNQYFDPMVAQRYSGLSQGMFSIVVLDQPVLDISDIAAYNEEEGLALSEGEINYLESVSDKLKRPLTDSEVFGFSQVNSEHCRHKIFNGQFIIDGDPKEKSLFKLIKETSAENPNTIVSAYKDNVAFIEGPSIVQFAPELQDRPSNYCRKSINSVISLKAETHNFPTTVEPFSGAATGSGGEIRDRMAGGQGSIPLAGTAVYMTPYSRMTEEKSWERNIIPRKWLYQTPLDILIKASNGASDYGNKFGQPLINGSLMCFEHEEGDQIQAYDKVIMLAGGIGYTISGQAIKLRPEKGDMVVVLGGDNYRIGMGGAAVSSADTGAFGESLELNAVQRSNPEMQKRVANAIRSLVENIENPIVSIHDHGAGGHLNCLSELLEDEGGKIYLNKLPIGDPTLSAKEIIGNESQERMGLIIKSEDLPFLERIAKRERCPYYIVGEVTGDHRFVFIPKEGKAPIDLAMEDFFGNSPKTIMEDVSPANEYAPVDYDVNDLHAYVEELLQLESVACKDWLTNKVDRCVGGRVAKQQCCGPLQLPLNNLGCMALDFEQSYGIATAMGHASIAALIDPASGSRLAVVESLTNLIWAPLKDGLRSVSLSANWMWPCNNPGEDARLYQAVEALSKYCIDLGINVPTGKDSLSMKQKYSDKQVKSPGTVIVSAVAECSDINKIVEPVLKSNGGNLYLVDFSSSERALGGSAFAQTRSKIGSKAAQVIDPVSFASAFDFIQNKILDGKIEAGHDISGGGLITSLLEICFSTVGLGLQIDLDFLDGDIVQCLMSENPAIILQSNDASIIEEGQMAGVNINKIGKPINEASVIVSKEGESWSFDIPNLCDCWFKTSYLLDRNQTAGSLAKARFDNYKHQALQYVFPEGHSGVLPNIAQIQNKPIAAVLREQGSNSERELANALFLAGFEVRDVHMTDLIEGRETLEDVNFLGAVGGFANSDVLGSAKGWAGAIIYNEKAKTAFDKFFSRDDVLSIGICNGCQLFMELNLINPQHNLRSRMDFNDSRKHESNFTSVAIQKNNSVMLSSMEGTRLGIWVSHGEGKFILPQDEADYGIVAKWGYDAYPANPNGSDYNTAMICSADGRHLATMPHLERSIFPWNWAYYLDGRNDQISPWIEAFVNARRWLESNRK